MAGRAAASPEAPKVGAESAVAVSEALAAVPAKTFNNQNDIKWSK